MLLASRQRLSKESDVDPIQVSYFPNTLNINFNHQQMVQLFENAAAELNSYLRKIY